MSAPRRIVLVSHSDLLGGAAIVTYRLMRTLRDMGHDAKLLVFKKYGNDPDVVRLGNPLVRAFSFLGERLQIFLRNGHSRKLLFKVSTGSLGLVLFANKYVRRADAIFLNWINQGTVSLATVGRLCRRGKKVVWTMHDMWCLTGACHYSFGCDRYRQSCGECPFLGKAAAPNDLSNAVWKRKKHLFDTTDIRFVGVSSWVKERAEESSLLRGRNVRVIHNAFPSDRFPIAPISAEPKFNLDRYKRVVVFGAANLEDKVKGLEFAIEALNIICDQSPEIAADAVAVFFGGVRDGKMFETLSFPHIVTGSLSEHEAIQYLYSRADVVLSTARYETLGGTLVEGMSCGAVPVTFGVDGRADIVQHKVNGYVAKYLDANDVAEGIRWAFDCGLTRQELHDDVVRRFDEREIARKYLAILDEFDN